jgi:hypothetical protein
MDEYIALIGHDDPGGVSLGEDEWTMTVTMAACIKNGGPLEEKDTIIFKDVPYPELKELQKQIASYSIIRFLGVAERKFDQDRVRIERVLETALTDKRFAAIAERLQQPVTYSSTRLGELKLDKRLDWFEGSINWLGRKVAITLDLQDGETTPREPEKTAESLLENQAAWDEKIRARAAQDLLELKNSTWTNDDDSMETEASFIAKMTLNSISVRPDGDFTFWFDDGDLFFGHSICVGGNLNGTLTKAEIAG